MDRMLIQGGVALEGTIAISGAKNAALPVMPTVLLTEEPVELANLPDVHDISSMRRLLQSLGAAITLPPLKPNTMVLQVSDILNPVADYELVRKMRASILVLGPLLARHGKAKVSLPGGCAIGTRPVDLHLHGLEQMGAKIELAGGYIHAEVNGRLQGADISMPFVSVGATENLMMAASLAQGTTILQNAAREPEITNLGQCLVAMGASIEGLGTDTITIEGVERLSGASHRILPDRVEFGTYVCAAAITHGKLTLQQVDLPLLGAMQESMERSGVKLTEAENGDVVVERQSSLKGVDIMTQPFPGFATDLQAQFMTTMCLAEGASMITESIFENRFMHVPELMRMGANINVHGSSALVRGVETLTGAPVMATDLRASVSLVLAGLAAKGETVVNRIYHLDRGYESLERKLSACGARIERVS